MLLEVLSDFQISIPELGRVEARTQPVVLLTSNNTRELTEALKRRCLYLWLDYPDARARARDRPPPRARARRAGRAQARRGHRDGPRPRPEEAAVDRRVDRLGAGAAAARRARTSTRETFRQTMSVIVKHRTDLDVVAERVGRQARRNRLGEPTPGFAAGIVELGEELRGEGMQVGTSALLDAFAALEQVGWTDHDQFREALAATLAKSPDDRRIFELVFDRFFFRAAEAAALREGVRERPTPRAASGRRRRRGGSRPRRAAPADRRGAARRQRGRDARPRPAGDRRVRAPGRGLGRHRRRRAAHPPLAGPARRAAARPAARRPAPRRRAARPAAPLRGDAAPRARARADRAHGDAAGQAPAQRARPRAADRRRCRTSPPCTASSRSSSGG